MEFYDFPYIGNNHPNWRTHIFQRGRSTTNQPRLAMNSAVTVGRRLPEDVRPRGVLRSTAGAPAKNGTGDQVYIPIGSYKCKCLFYWEHDDNSIFCWILGFPVLRQSMTLPYLPLWIQPCLRKYDWGMMTLRGWTTVPSQSSQTVAMDP